MAALALLLVLVAYFHLQQSHAVIDPCNAYTAVSNPFKRSSNYSLTEDELGLCDSSITAGWYRFQGGAGEDLVNSTKCRIGYCGTVYPVCLEDDGLPLPNQEKNATACIMDDDYKCGTDKLAVKIKNCGNYRVYHLTPPPSCPSAYCVGSEIHCLDHECSETGFTPCSPVCPKNVTISPAIAVEEEFVNKTRKIIFSCNFAAPLGHPDLLYNVYWYVNDHQVAMFSALPRDRVGTDGLLKENDWRHIGLGMVVQCSLRARFNETLPPAKHFYSQPFFAGLQVNQTEIAVEEGKNAFIEVRSTVPTPSRKIATGNVGTLRVNVYTPNGKSSLNYDPLNVVHMITACGVDLRATNWSAWTNLEIMAAVDSKYEKSRIMLVRLGVFKDGSDVNDVWTNMTLPDVKVTVIDKDIELSKKICQSNNDPHMVTFKGRGYENQELGEFILYEHDVYPFSVHTKYQDCQSPWQATCNCGIAIRAYESLLVVDRCSGKATTYGTTHVNHISYTGCDDSHLFINRTDNTYSVRLPTGTKVKFTLYDGAMNGVQVIPSPADIGQTKGLCGKLHSENDFVLRDGSFTTDTAQFITAWKVSTNTESFFVKNPTFVRLVPILPYCFCDQNNGLDAIQSVNCTMPYPVPPATQEYTSNLKAFLYTCGKKRKRDLRTSDYVSDGPSGWAPVEMNKRYRRSVTPEWRDGWTEASARAHCQQAFDGNAGVVLMEEATGFFSVKQSLVDSCVLDVKYTAGTYYTRFTVEIFKEICKEEVERNVTLLATEVGRTLVAEIANASCPMDCSGHGACQQGECQCDQGFMGVDCSVNKSLPPSNLYIPLSGLCNTRERACQSTSVLAGNLPETSTVFCGLRAFQIREDGAFNSSQWSVTVAEPWTQGQVQCPFPRHRVKRQIQSDVMAEGYMISVSNDNVTYSTELPVIIYDADCVACSTDNLTCISTGQCSATTGSTPTTAEATTASSATTSVSTGSATTTSTPPSTGTEATSSTTSPSADTATTSSTTSPSANNATTSSTTSASAGTATTSSTTTSSAGSATTSSTPPSTGTEATSSTSLSTSTDPCTSYYSVLNKYERSIGYVMPSDQAHLCDRELTSGWFRFESGAGGDLQPMSNCSLGRCGTVYPVCIKDGKIPTVPEGEVTLVVCILEDDVCKAEWPIRVKNCGGYRVYYLTPPPDCPTAYCVGTEVRCPPGQCSSNGFTPGCSDCPTTTTSTTTTTNIATIDTTTNRPVDPESSRNPDERSGGTQTPRDHGETGIPQSAVIALSVCGVVLGAAGVVAAVALYFKVHNAPSRCVSPNLQDKWTDQEIISSRPGTTQSIILSIKPPPKV